MHFFGLLSQAIAVSLAALALAAPASMPRNVIRQPIGSAVVENDCTFDVQVLSTLTGQPATLAPGTRYSETFGGTQQQGESLKVSPDGNFDDNFSSLEYMLDTDGQVFYDISNINGYPFARFGDGINPSDPSCASPQCPAGDNPCADAYNEPDPPVQPNFSCSQSVTLVYHVCST